MNETVGAVYRAESRRVFATLVRLLGDFDLAEEALHEAFRAALEQWPREGVPENPRAWLVSAGRFKAIDSIRRQAAFDVRSTKSKSSRSRRKTAPKRTRSRTIACASSSPAATRRSRPTRRSRSRCAKSAA